jgi:hypothetical protein
MRGWGLPLPSHTDDEALAMAFLLGRLAGEERERVDARLFADDEFFALLRGCEEELIRDHLTGRLSREDETLFRRKYLTTPLFRENVKFASAIVYAIGGRASITEKSRPIRRSGIRPGRWRLSLAIACATAAVLGIGLLQSEFSTRRLSAQIALLQQSQHRLQETVAASAGRRVLASFVLTPGLQRRNSEHASVLSLPPGDGQVEFQLQADSDSRATRYRVAIQTAEGPEVWSSVVHPGPARDGAIGISVPVGIFRPADYIAVLDDADGGPAHESYAFRIER